MTLTIGKLAKQANVTIETIETIETIRYYQRKGLLIEPEKPATGYRHYPLIAVPVLYALFFKIKPQDSR